MNTRLLALAAMVTAATVFGAGTPKKGGIAFRFDDNQPIENWKRMAAVFEKHGLRFSMGICPLEASRNPEYAALLSDMARRGYEIMDHTPEHTVVKMTMDTPEAAQQLSGADFVNCVKDRTVYFKFRFNPSHPSCKPWVIGVKNGHEVTMEDGSWNDSDVSRYVVFPDGRIFLFAKHGEKPVLCNQYGENDVQLPDMSGVKVTVANRDAFEIDDRALELLLQRSRDLFAKMGVPAPRTYVVAGGWGLYPSPEQLERTCGRKFGYASGTAFDAEWSSTYSGRQLDRFAMSAYWNSLESFTVEQEKKLFADLLAKNYVIPVISHMWLHGVNNDFNELLRRNDEFLAWVKEKGILVKNHAEWADILYGNPADPQYNIFPSLACDLNDDQIPDGYDIKGGTPVKDGVISGKGELFYISSLSGFSAGRNILRVEGRSLNEKPSKLIIAFHLCARDSKNAREDRVIAIELPAAPDFASLEKEIVIPEWVAGSHVTCIIDGEGQLRNISLAAAPEVK